MEPSAPKSCWATTWVSRYVGGGGAAITGETINRVSRGTMAPALRATRAGCSFMGFSRGLGVRLNPEKCPDCEMADVTSRTAPAATKRYGDVDGLNLKRDSTVSVDHGSELVV